jgi:hypothetical protein
MKAYEDLKRAQEEFLPSTAAQSTASLPLGEFSSRKCQASVVHI